MYPKSPSQNCGKRSDHVPRKDGVEYQVVGGGLDGWKG